MRVNNQVTLIGRLGDKPEIKEVGETCVAKFNIAIQENYTSKSGEKVEKTNWQRIETWGRNAENCNEHLMKGDQVAILGRLETDEYHDRESGEKRWSTKVVASSVQFLEKGPEKRKQLAQQEERGMSR